MDHVLARVVPAFALDRYGNVWSQLSMGTASQTVRAHVLQHGCSCELCWPAGEDDEQVAVLVRREPVRPLERRRDVDAHQTRPEDASPFADALWCY